MKKVQGKKVTAAMIAGLLYHRYLAFSEHGNDELAIVPLQLVARSPHFIVVV